MEGEKCQPTGKSVGARIKRDVTYAYHSDGVGFFNLLRSNYAQVGDVGEDVDGGHNWDGDVDRTRHVALWVHHLLRHEIEEVPKNSNKFTQFKKCVRGAKFSWNVKQITNSKGRKDYLPSGVGE